MRVSSSSFLAAVGMALVILPSAVAQQEPVPRNRTKISYVIDPFEDVTAGIYYEGSTEPMLSTDALFGKGSIKVQASGIDAEMGWISPDRPHNCYGADSVSVWTKTNATNATVRLVFYDDRACIVASRISPAPRPCNESDSLDARVVIEEQIQESDGWRQLLVNSSDLSQIDLRRIRGWMIEVQDSDGHVLIDQLSCKGDGRLFGAPFYTGIVDYAEAEEEGTWMESFYQSEMAANQSLNTLKNGRLTMDWVVEQVETWGGFNDVAHLAPGSGYYNLTGANGMVLGYEVNVPASVPERSIFRLVLQDTSHCETECDTDYHATERWYSFQSIMDESGTGEITIRLEGSTDASSPFWYTGWSGIPGNQMLDLGQIKGYTFEAVLDSMLPLGSFVTGSFTLFDISAVVLGNRTQSDACVVEEGLQLVNHERFTRIEFLASTCCDVCDEDPECNYAFTNGRDCFVASSVDPDYVGLLNSEIEVTTFQSFWMNDATKRGDWCEKCLCRESKRSIDCQGADLVILPKTFELGWTPTSIDLRGNPNLVLLGTGSLDEVGKDLEAIYLPSHMKFMAPGSMRTLPNLKAVTFEDTEGIDSQLINAISSLNDFFGDVCCAPGETIELEGSSLAVCELEISRPGVDSVYEPFINYPEATAVKVLTPSSTFLAEAAESVEKCAEYCTIDIDCEYFLYDARLPNAEHVCLLLEDKGPTEEKVCCDEDHFADENKTIPGYTAGRPPRTRHRDDNAAVVFSATELDLNERNDYTGEYTLSLGSDPLRGAVWVEPEIISSSGMNLDVVISPARVVLYNVQSSQTISVKVSKITAKSKELTLVLRNSIKSCDSAFIVEDGGNEGLIYLSVAVPEESDGVNLGLAIGLPVAFVLLLIVLVFLWQDAKRKQNDTVWTVKKEDLKFADPPEIIGRGTFGLVLLAEYRGTQVAVKRVIPPKAKQGSSSGATSIVSGSVMNSRTNDAFASRTNSSDDDSGEEGSISGKNEGLVSGGSYVGGGIHSGSHGSSSGSGGRSFAKKSSGASGFGFGTSSGIKGALSSLFNSGTVAQSTSTKATRKGSVSDASTWKKLRSDFIEEMRYLSKLRHPCVTTVMGAVIGHNIEPMLVMEYMEHGSLYDILHNDTMVIDGEVLLPILVDISRGMRFLHSADPPVIHGDLKAANILVDNKFRAKVTDFGLSQKKNLGGTGTPFWMAPELLRFESSNTIASDTFSFGVILYEVYSRKDPYDGEDPREVIRLIKDKKVQKRPPAPKNCPTQIQSLMKDCFAEEPDKRPTFEEIDTRLRRMDEKDIATGDMEVSTRVSLFDIFPRHIAEALRDGRKVEPEHRDCVTIFFSDIVDFTEISSRLDPRKIADLLDRMYSKFDGLADKYQVFKVETIGDAYMAVTNLVHDQPGDHAKRIAQFAIDAIEAANGTLIDEDDVGKGVVNIRVGFHSGSIVADVVGTRNPRYCLFGDAVNTSHRMESNSKANRIHCSAASAALLRDQFPELPLRSRGTVNIKGKGDMATFWVNEQASKRRSTADRASIVTGIERALAEVDVIKEEDEEESRELSVFSSGGCKAHVGVETAPPIERQNDIEAQAPLQ